MARTESEVRRRSMPRPSSTGPPAPGERPAPVGSRRNAPRPVRERSRSEARRERRTAPPPRQLKLTRLGVAVAVTATVALFAGTALVSGLLTPPGGPGPGAPPATAQVVARTEAASVAFDADGAWVADDHDGAVRHVNPSTGATIGRPVHVGGRPIAVAAGFGRVWVADISDSLVWEINPGTGKVVGSPIPVAQGPVSLAAGDGGVWVASLLAGTVSLIDPHTAEVVASSALPDGAVRLTLGPDGVWVSGQTHTLTRVAPRPDGVSLRWRTVGVGQGPLGVAAGDGSVWVANVQSGTVSRVDPATVRVTATFSVPGTGGASQSDPEMVALWQNRLWVADGQQGAAVALDPGSGAQIGASVKLPGVVRQLVLDGGGTLWATTANPGTLVRFS